MRTRHENVNVGNLLTNGHPKDKRGGGQYYRVFVLPT